MLIVGIAYLALVAVNVYIVTGRVMYSERNFNNEDKAILITSLIPLLNIITTLVTVIVLSGDNGWKEQQRYFNKKYKCRSCEINFYYGSYLINGQSCPCCGCTNYSETKDPVAFPKFSLIRSMKTQYVFEKIRKQKIKNKHNEALMKQLEIYEKYQKKKLAQYNNEQMEKGRV